MPLRTTPTQDLQVFNSYSPTVTLTCGAGGIAAGELVTLKVTRTASIAAGLGVSSWTLDDSSVNATGFEEYSYSGISAGCSAGATVTATHAGGAVGWQISGQAWGTGYDATTPLLVATDGNSGNDTSVTPSATPTAGLNVLVLLRVYDGSASPTITATGFTTLSADGNPAGAGTPPRIIERYQVISSTTGSAVTAHYGGGYNRHAWAMLVYQATAGGTTVALAGTTRAMPRVTGAALLGATALAGRVRSGPRATGLCGSAVPLQGDVRSMPRTFAAIATSTALAGSTRSGPRATGAATVVITLQGATRAVPRLPGSALGATLTLGGGRTRSIARLPGGAVGSVVPVGGTLRSIERLTGSFQPVAILRGIVCVTARLLPAPLTSTIGVAASATRTLARVAPATMSSGTSVTGTLRAVPRLPGGSLGSIVVIGGHTRSAGRLPGAALGAGGPVPLLGMSRNTARLLNSALGFGTPRAVHLTVTAVSRVHLAPAVRARVSLSVVVQ